MALWCWFIPIISLFRLVQIMNEIWEITQTQIRKYNTSYIRKNGGFIIGLWWTLFIISNFIGRYLFNTSMNLESVEEMIESSHVLMISDTLQIVEAFLVILIVTQLSRMESVLAEEVKKSGGTIILDKYVDAL